MTKTMDRIDRILTDPDFLAHEKRIREAEADRIYCRHDTPHFLDVARVASLIEMEENLELDRELLYAAALLHDIGRWMEYATGADHAKASAHLAVDILRNSGFSPAEVDEIISAIAGHREKDMASTAMGTLLYRADKLSRNCVACAARGTCKNFRNGEHPRLLY